jgi:serine/threonine protein kinase
LEEGLIIKEFNHGNVLKLIGIYFEDNLLPVVVLPYMQNGDLLSYIRETVNKLTIENLINFAIDVAEGMSLYKELFFNFINQNFSIARHELLIKAKICSSRSCSEKLSFGLQFMCENR